MGGWTCRAADMLIYRLVNAPVQCAAQCVAAARHVPINAALQHTPCHPHPAVAAARLARPPALNRGGGGKITAREIVLNAVSHFSALGESGAFYSLIIGVHLAQNIVPPPALPLGGQL